MKGSPVRQTMNRNVQVPVMSSKLKTSDATRARTQRFTIVRFRDKWKIELEGHTVEQHATLPLAIAAARVLARFNQPSRVDLLGRDEHKTQSRVLGSYP